ncbi:histidine kinase [Myroides marinus]|uniref:sensor histidine kinase n=1 Tax=Myroides TaxID=76831 RepID=UPI002577D6A8|nr:histidine kinase [Myroides marinus]MDM1391570.1 histidine kinase [Myroides marinus]MDM1533011.1 histidine kinase [Myroides marinus]MDM1540012.1 histidine kinase [Myroides marinus]
MRYLLTVFLWLCVSVVFGQGVVTKQYTIENGLMANDVRALCVDSKGVLWIGSRSGLAQKIQGVVKPNEDAARYRYTNITDIIEDDQKTIWVGSYGQGILYRAKGEVRVISTQQGLISNRIRRLFDHEGAIYVATSDGVSIISKKDLSVKNPTFKSSKNNPFEVSDFFEYKGEVYVATINDGIFKIVGDKLEFIEKVGRVFAAINLDGLVFYGCQDGLIIKDIATNKVVKHYNIPAVKDIKRANNQLYVVSGSVDENNGHIYRWDGVSLNNITEYLGTKKTDYYSISYDERNDFLYLGTKSEGVFQVDLFSPLSFDSLYGSVSVVKGLNDRIFVFSSKGLSIQDKDKELLTMPLQRFKYFQEQQYKKYADYTTKANHFYEIDYTTPANRIVFYSAVPYGNSMWVSSNVGVFQIAYDGYLLSYHSIHTYRFGFYKNRFIETNPYGGVRIYNDLANMDYRYYFRVDSEDIPRDVVDITYVDDKMYFAGALDGLYVLDNKEFTSLAAKNLFAEHRIKKITNGDKNTLYVSTDFNDIYLLEVKSGKYTVKDFISNKDIEGTNITLLKYVDGKLFIGTSKGLTVIDKNNKFYFNKEQGFGKGEILSSTVKDNLMYIGTSEGLYILDITYFKQRVVQYQVNISQIEVNGQELDKKGEIYHNIRELHLKSKENNLQIGFEVLGTKFPDKLNFQYRLKLGETWMNVKENKLELHYLEPGVYPIDIKIMDYDSGNELIYPLLFLEIEKPFYAKTWFIILCIGLLATSFYIIYVIRVRQLRKLQRMENKKLEYEKRLAEVQLQFVRSQMNSHFIFNVLSSIQYYIIKEEVDDALFYLERFAKLIRTTLEMSTKERITLKEECEYLKIYVDIENMRLDGRVTFKIEKGNVDLAAVNIPPLLLQPFVENALVHAFPSSIENPLLVIATERLSDSSLVIEITDNGIGEMSIREKKHESKGLSIVKERMSLLQQYLDEDLIIDHHTKGTTVRLILRNVFK